MYCTYLTIYTGNKLPPFYIGSSSIEKVDNGYHGSVSSKIYKDVWYEELKNNSKAFKTIVLTTHSTREEAILKETKLHQSLNVVSNPLYANMSIAGGKFGIMTFSRETRLKMSKSSKGKQKSAEHKAKIDAANKLKAQDPKFIEKLRKPKCASHGMNVSKAMKEHIKTKEHCENISKALEGRKNGTPSDETRKKMSAAQAGKKQPTLQCPHCSKVGGYAAMKRFHFDRCKSIC